MDQDKKVTLWVILATLIIVVGGLMLWSKSSPEVNGPVDTAMLVKETSHRYTNATTPKVTVVEFGDYQCPACALAHPIIKQGLAKYSETKNVEFVFRNFPLQQHVNAITSARAAEAAALQGKFWEMHDVLYENQSKWENEKNPYPLFEEYARSLSLDLAKFKKDYESTSTGERISEDQKDGLAVGVNATPTFFVNGKKLEGVPSLNDFTKAIDKALAE
jgi:protein-disulfide isomerase